MLKLFEGTCDALLCFRPAEYRWKEKDLCVKHQLIEENTDRMMKGYAPRNILTGHGRLDRDTIHRGVQAAVEQSAQIASEEFEMDQCGLPRPVHIFNPRGIKLCTENGERHVWMIEQRNSRTEFVQGRVFPVQVMDHSVELCKRCGLRRSRDYDTGRIREAWMV